MNVVHNQQQILPRAESAPPQAGLLRLPISDIAVLPAEHPAESSATQFWSPHRGAGLS